MNFDPSKVQTIDKQAVRKSQDFDISYNSEKQTFLLSDNFIEKNGLGHQGMAFGVYPDGSLILSVQDEENSKFYKTKTGSSKKGKGFKHPILSDRLTERGFTSGPLPIELAGEANGVKYYKVTGSETGSTGMAHPDPEEVGVEVDSVGSLMDSEDEFL